MNENLLQLAFEGNPIAISFLVVFFIFFIGWVQITGGDMGVHPDTGRPIKSLNTSDGKRARQRRRYHRNK